MQGSVCTMQCKAAPRSEWLEYRADSEDWCILCEKHATDGHLQLHAHMRKVWWYNTSRILPGVGAPMVPGNPDHFVWKADKQMFSANSALSTQLMSISRAPCTRGESFIPLVT